MDTMKIGLTGATGQLGRLVVQELLKTVPAQDIVAIVRSAAKAAATAVRTSGSPSAGSSSTCGHGARWIDPSWVHLHTSSVT